MSAVRDGRLLPPRVATVLASAGIPASLNFFAVAAQAKQWLGQHRDVRGEVITIRDAADAGRVVFGDVLVES